MTQEGVNQNDLKDMITSRGNSFVALWAAGILLLYAVGGYFGVRQLLGYKAETEKIRQARIESPTTDLGARAPDIRTASEPHRN